MSVCPRTRGLKLRDLATGEECGLSCWSWECPSCGPWKARRLRRSLRLALEPYENQTWGFLTVTLPAEDHDPGQDTRDQTKRLWARLKALEKRVNRRRAQEGRERLRMLWVVELHQDGTPHLHGLIDGYLPVRWLQTQAHEVGLGHVDLEAARDPVGYLAKYLTTRKTREDPETGERELGGLADPRLKHVRRYGARGPVELESIYACRGSDGEWALVVEVGTSEVELDHWQMARAYQAAADVAQARAEELLRPAGLAWPEHDPTDTDGLNPWLRSRRELLDRALAELGEPEARKVRACLDTYQANLEAKARRIQAVRRRIGVTLRRNDRDRAQAAKLQAHDLWEAAGAEAETGQEVAVA